MKDIADKIYAATGLTLGAEAAAKIGQMIQQARRDNLEAVILMLEQEAKAAPTNSLMAELRNQVADHFIARLRALGEKE